ncbi:hypothetical protein Q31b_12110 [Novipirellula aureliae]|uniref:Uncharacterized protein n=1 Tax=Novipirellula aureliae TaxID=2527966 RepID=A0A5C6E8L9_9BACT|nr:hypothetical protein [Novipirellula aureliae]TWU46033.1 hypothetical protein Q31b_12110 [Novipirellula aureliae]
MSRKSWTDEQGETTLIDDYAKQSADFIAAMADGKIDKSEVDAQEAKLVAIMNKIEPTLDDQQHAAITELLCEMSVYSVMQMLHAAYESRMSQGVSGLKL